MVFPGSEKVVDNFLAIQFAIREIKEICEGAFSEICQPFITLSELHFIIFRLKDSWFDECSFCYFFSRSNRCYLTTPTLFKLLSMIN